MKKTLLLLTIAMSCFACGDKLTESQLFASIDPLESGIDFTNNLEADRRLNIINFNGFYNGGGVATGDINNDGLIDIFFTSNKEKNRLYLNKGNLKFEDITDKAKVGGKAEWSTGVTMVDINADGLLDIYVSAVTKFKGLKGHNELYINNGDATFTEASAEWGLNYTTYSNQASFFDYDHDGDLDCFIVNMSHENALVLKKSDTRTTFDPNTGDVLLRNEGDHFTYVSKEADIFRSEIGFGLAVTIADLNDDGWEDIYVSNDFFENDYCYINQQDGTFKESGADFFGHMSRFSMGADAADINNDGYLDLFTLDMAPEDETIEKKSLGEEPYHIYDYKKTYGFIDQYGRNCLQVSNKGKDFYDVAALSGVEATDWSWSPFLLDLDNDGLKDVFISNGMVKRPNDLDLINYVEDYLAPPKSEADLAQYFTDYYAKMPVGAAHDYVYKGKGNLIFEDKSVEWGFEEETISNGASYADLDNDGDLEIIINRINRPALIYQNLTREKFKTNYINVRLEGYAKNTKGIGAKVYVKTNETLQMQQVMLTRGFLSSVSPDLHFGLGKNDQIDSVWVKWNTGEVSIAKNPISNGTVTVKQKNTLKPQEILKISAELVPFEQSDEIQFKHQENNFIDFSQDALAPFMASTEGPAIAVDDVNDDGLADVFTGGAKGQKGELWMQRKEGKFDKIAMPEFEKDSLYEDIDAVFFDMDADGDSDLYVGSGGNESNKNLLQDRLYENEGDGIFTLTKNRLPEFFGNTACVRASDFDADGDLDLFVGTRSVPDSYGEIPESNLLINDGNGHFTKFEKINEGDLKLGMVTDAQWKDIDADGDSDLIVVGEWMPITLFTNENGAFAKSEIQADTPTKGLWHSLQITDFDADGDLDIIAGNLGRNTRLIKKDGNGKLRLYVKDFDGNGKKEQLLCYNRNDAWYPINNRDELGKTLPGIIKKRFTTNAEYAGKSIDEIFTPEELKDAEILEADLLASIYLENSGTKGFKSTELPLIAQYAPVFDLSVSDINEDGFLDVLGGGNFYGVSTYQARYDASKGFYLLGGKNGFQETGSLDINGEIRAIQSIEIKGSTHFLFGRNDKTLIGLHPTNRK